MDFGITLPFFTIVLYGITAITKLIPYKIFKKTRVKSDVALECDIFSSLKFIYCGFWQAVLK